MQYVITKPYYTINRTPTGTRFTIFQGIYINIYRQKDKGQIILGFRDFKLTRKKCRMFLKLIISYGFILCGFFVNTV